MFVIPVKYNGTDFVVNCVKSIRNSGNTDVIAVVDSNSTDKSYFDKLEPYYVTICDVGNINYGDGAMWFCYENFPEEEYIFNIHDSMIINENLSFLKEADFTAFCHFPVQYWGPMGASQELETLAYCMRRITEVGINISPAQMYGFWGLFGTVFFAKRTVLNKLCETKLHTILPYDKFTACCSERLWGFFLHHIGIDISKNSLMGDNIQSGKSKAIQKIVVSRQ